MLVYRVCHKDEYEVIFKEHSLINIGNTYSHLNPAVNTHQYKPDVRYIHFFEKLMDITYWYSYEGNYVCTYDIPDDLLKNYRGIGYYNEQIKFRTQNKVPEFAVPSNLVDFNYLVKVEYIKETILFEDFFDDYYKQFLETVYDVQGPSLERKGSKPNESI